jgi:hypothetical protein
MEKFICEYCKNIYSSKSVLIKHQKTTKKCVEIQKNINKEIINIEYNCKYCNKNFTLKQTLQKHENTCNCKKEYEIDEFKKDIENINSNHKKEIENINSNHKKEIENIKIINKKLEKEIVDLKLKISELNGELKSVNKVSECIYEIAKQPKNITNNNKTVNITGTIDFNDIDKIKEIIDTKYNINHFLCGQKGFAHFAAQNLLKDDDGNYNYTCTDPSRQIFKFKNTKGEIEKDVDAKKLTTYLVEGGIKDKALDISMLWCQNEGKIDSDKFMVVSEKQDSILSLIHNNNEFKKELVSLVTI